MAADTLFLQKEAMNGKFSFLQWETPASGARKRGKQGRDPHRLLQCKTVEVLRISCSFYVYVHLYTTPFRQHLD